MERAVAAGRRLLAKLTFAAALLISTKSARADSGDVGFGPLIGLARAGDDAEGFAELRLELRIDYGLTRFLSLRASGGAGLGVAAEGIPELGKGFARGLTSAGIVVAYDVWTFVPEVFVYGGAGFGSFSGGRAGALAAIRWYLSRTTSVTVSGGGEYDWGTELAAWVGGIGVWL